MNTQLLFDNGEQNLWGKWLTEGEAHAAGKLVHCRNSSTQRTDDWSSSDHLTAAQASISCTTFNILAPIYKRIGSEGCRESQFYDSWLARNQCILDNLLSNRSSIICLQEVWLGNTELVHLYDKNLGRAGYQTFKLARTNNRGDGLLTAVQSEKLSVLNYKELMFYDCGDRVAQFFHLRFRTPCNKRGREAGQELLLVNTHLLFPHDSRFCLVRLWQVYSIIECLERFKVDHGLAALPVILCGDWNGSKRGHVYKFLRSQGFVSSYDTAHSYTDSDAHRWVSHRNHRGNICGVDFIWLRNPGRRRKHLSTSWKEAVLEIIKAKLLEAGFCEKDGLHISGSEENWDVVCLLQGLGLTGIFSEGLRGALLQIAGIGTKLEETEVSDENKFLVSGFLKSKEPTRLTGPLCDASNAIPGSLTAEFAAERVDSELQELREPSSRQMDACANVRRGFAIHKASLFPPEVEQGIWPDSYSLSDHAPLTVVFTPAIDIES